MAWQQPVPAIGGDNVNRNTATLGYASGVTTLERDARIRAQLANLPAMTAEQRHRQREGWAYGNLKVDEPTLPTPPSLSKR
jgi:hypothetical protein